MLRVWLFNAILSTTNIIWWLKGSFEVNYATILRKNLDVLAELCQCTLLYVRTIKEKHPLGSLRVLINNYCSSVVD